jgi:CheY-like chemotaxis protein
MKALWVGTNAETLANAQQRWVLAEPLGDSVVLPIEALSSVGGELAGYDLVLLAATEEALVVHPALDQLLQLDVPVLVTAAPAQEAIALQLLQRGASDYVLIVSDQSYDGLVCKAQRLAQAHRHCHHQEQPPSPQTDAAAIAALTNRISSANQVPDRAMAIAEGLQAILGADQICLVRNQGGQPGDVVATSVSEVGRSPETETAGGPRVGAKPISRQLLGWAAPCD